MSHLSEEALAVAFPPGSFGFPFRYLPVTVSTNDDALAWARNGAPHGAFVVADVQTKGRGRHGREWHGGEGHSLLATWVLCPRLSPNRLGLLGGAVAVAAARAVRGLTGLPAMTKWPNDLWIEGRKAGGILPEAVWSGGQLDAVVAGIGLNVHQSEADLPPSPRIHATSIFLESGRHWHRVILLKRISEELEQSVRWAETNPRQLLDEWQSLETTLGREIEATSEDRVLRGRVREILPDGSLLLVYEGREYCLNWGEVTLTP